MGTDETSGEYCSSQVIRLIAGGEDTRIVISPPSLPKPLNEWNAARNTFVSL